MNLVIPQPDPELDSLVERYRKADEKHQAAAEKLRATPTSLEHLTEINEHAIATRHAKAHLQAQALEIAKVVQRRYYEAGR